MKITLKKADFKHDFFTTSCGREFSALNNEFPSLKYWVQSETDIIDPCLQSTLDLALLLHVRYFFGESVYTTGYIDYLIDHDRIGCFEEFLNYWLLRHESVQVANSRELNRIENRERATRCALIYWLQNL